MHNTTGRWKLVLSAAAIMALATTAGCGGSGNSGGGKSNPNIVGTWVLEDLETAGVDHQPGTTITCPGTAEGISCSTNQEVYFGANQVYEAGTNGTETAVGNYNLNGNLLTVTYHYLATPATIYTDTYIAKIVLTTSSGFVNGLYATLSTTTSPNTSYVGATYEYGFLQ